MQGGQFGSKLFRDFASFPRVWICMRCTTVQLWDIYRRILLRSLVLCKHRRAEGERGGGEGSTFFLFFFPPREEARVIPICTTTCKMVLAFLYLCTSTCIVHVHLPPSLCNNQAYEKESTKVFLLLFFFFSFLIKTKRISETYLFSYLKDTLRRNIKLNLSLKFHETRWHTFPNIFLKILRNFHHDER